MFDSMEMTQTHKQMQNTLPVPVRKRVREIIALLQKCRKCCSEIKTRFTKKYNFSLDISSSRHLHSCDKLHVFKDTRAMLRTKGIFCQLLTYFQVRAARNLLRAVTQLLILADVIDVNVLLRKLQRVEDDLENLKNVNSQAELKDSMDRFALSAQDLMSQAAKRQHELQDPALRDDLAAARAILKKHSAMLLTASKAYVRHPELAAAKANRDFVMRQVQFLNLTSLDAQWN